MIGIIKLAPLLCLLLFVSIIALFEVGRRVGISRLAADPEGAHKGVGAVEGSVFALVGLLIAFTFSGAAARFEARRDLIVQETNAIGTAWLRIDLLPTTDQQTMRKLFREYLDSRLDAYRKLPDLVAAEASLAHAVELQSRIWEHAMEATRNAGSPPLTTVLVPALNEMFDIAATRTQAQRMHPPMAIFGMLVALVLAGALLVGYAMAGARNRNWLHVVGFALATSLSVYVIIDLEYPRLGFIRVDAADEMLVDLRATMK
jgi:hypothetical protein